MIKLRGFKFIHAYMQNSFLRSLKNSKLLNKKYLSFFLIFICTIFNAAAQYFLKIGTRTLVFDLTLLSNYSLFLGLLLYTLSAGFLIFALKNEELSRIYPIVSLTYIWVLFISVLMLGETIQPMQVVGISSILIGVGIITGVK
jgi:drug/metabolite transporter (DMT)-like permease